MSKMKLTTELEPGDRVHIQGSWETIERVWPDIGNDFLLVKFTTKESSYGYCEPADRTFETKENQ